MTFIENNVNQPIYLELDDYVTTCKPSSIFLDVQEISYPSIATGSVRFKWGHTSWVNVIGAPSHTSPVLETNLLFLLDTL